VTFALYSYSYSLRRKKYISYMKSCWNKAFLLFFEDFQLLVKLIVTLLLLLYACMLIVNALGDDSGIVGNYLHGIQAYP